MAIMRAGSFNLKIAFIPLFVALFGIVLMAQTYKCLPSDVKEEDVVGFRRVISKTGEARTEKVTVKQTLKKMRAACLRGKLVDGKGRQIRFYYLQGCWGNPPADYIEILDRQRKEIGELRKRYTVIEMTCNPGGIPPQSIL